MAPDPTDTTSASIPLYSKENLPEDFAAPGGAAWASFRKTALTRAIHIDGPFRVETSESENEPFYCESGWLAIDARGYPYAIADEEFAQIYEPEPEAEQPSEPGPRPEDVAEGWRGCEPPEGTRRALILQAIRDWTHRAPGDCHLGRFAERIPLDLADAIEEALLAAAGPTPTWRVKEKGEEPGWIRVEPNYHYRLVPEPGLAIQVSPTWEQLHGGDPA